MKNLKADLKVKVYVTTDYSQFKNILGNRALVPSKIERIMNDIKRGINFLPYCPILVDENGNIIDGQHRFAVAKKIKSKVWFIIAPTLDIIDVAALNSNTDKWKAKDFIACFMSKKNQHYVNLNSFLKSTKFPLTVALGLLNTENLGPGRRTVNAKLQFEKGSFTINNEDFALQVAKNVKLFEKYEFSRRAAFIGAIGTLTKAGLCNFEALKAKFDKKPDQAFTYTDNEKEYLSQLEVLYNRGNKKRIQIFK